MSETALLPYPAAAAGAELPTILASADERTRRRFFEFFTVTIRNPNTRQAYARAVRRFLTWCQEHGVPNLEAIEPMGVAAYIEEMTQSQAPQTVKQHLAALRMLFDWLVTGHVIPVNPASSVRGPRYSYTQGKTPVLEAGEMRELLQSIDPGNLVGLRDRALIGLMVFTFARVSAALSMKVEDYYASGKRWTVRLHEKGGKFLQVPVHHELEEYLDSYLDGADLREARKSPLFRAAAGKTRVLTERALDREKALRMIKRRARAAGLSPELCCHTFRGTGITNFLDNGGELDVAQQMAAHADARTTRLYDRRKERVTLAEIERIRF